MSMGELIPDTVEKYSPKLRKKSPEIEEVVLNSVCDPQPAM